MLIKYLPIEKEMEELILAAYVDLKYPMPYSVKEGEEKKETLYLLFILRPNGDVEHLVEESWLVTNCFEPCSILDGWFSNDGEKDMVEEEYYKKEYLDPALMDDSSEAASDEKK